MGKKHLPPPTLWGDFGSRQVCVPTLASSHMTLGVSHDSSAHQVLVWIHGAGPSHLGCERMKCDRTMSGTNTYRGLAR